MNIVITVLAVAILAFGVLFTQRNATLRTLKREVTDSTEVLSEQQEQTSPTEKPQPEANESLIESPTPTTQTAKPNSPQSNILDYRYDNAEILSSSQNSLSLKGFDDPKSITNWYKEKIIAEGMNVKTFVETKTNDNVLNKLVGANGQKEIRVEIKKDAGSSFVEIEVSLPGQ